MLKKLNIAAAFAAALFTTATVMVPAGAAQAEELKLTLDRSDLHTPVGLRNALKKLRLAARMQCQGDLLVLTKAELKCREQVEDQWLAAIGSEPLTRLARSRGPEFALAD